MSCSSLRRSSMARVNEGSHSFTCHPHVYPQVEWAILPLLPMQPRRASPHFDRYSFPVPLRVGGWVGLSGLVKYWGGLPARRRSPVPVPAAAAENRTRDRRIASPTLTTRMTIDYDSGRMSSTMAVAHRTTSSFLHPQTDCWAEERCTYPRATANTRSCVRVTSCRGTSYTTSTGGYGPPRDRRTAPESLIYCGTEHFAVESSSLDLRVCYHCDVLPVSLSIPSLISALSSFLQSAEFSYLDLAVTWRLSETPPGPLRRLHLGSLRVKKELLPALMRLRWRARYVICTSRPVLRHH